MLDEAERAGVALTNLSLQKLLYFAHGLYLIEKKQPLVSGYFEAWQYGPVHPAAYRAFKSAGSNPITFRAESRDVLTGETRAITEPADPEVRALIMRVMTSYGRMSPGRLVDISHAEKAPWHFIVDKGRTSVAFGMRIPDDVIRDRFKHHKVSVGLVPRSGEPDEDAPLA